MRSMTEGELRKIEVLNSGKTIRINDIDISDFLIDGFTLTLKNGRFHLDLGIGFRSYKDVQKEKEQLKP